MISYPEFEKAMKTLEKTFLSVNPSKNPDDFARDWRDLLDVVHSLRSLVILLLEKNMDKEARQHTHRWFEVTKISKFSKHQKELIKNIQNESSSSLGILLPELRGVRLMCADCEKQKDLYEIDTSMMEKNKNL